MINGVDQSDRLAGKIIRRFGLPAQDRIIRENVRHHVRFIRCRMTVRLFSRAIHFGFDFGAKRSNVIGRENGVAQEIAFGLEDRVAIADGLQLGLAAIFAVVVGRRVRVEPHHLGFHQRRYGYSAR